MGPSVVVMCNMCNICHLVDGSTQTNKTLLESLRSTRLESGVQEVDDLGLH